jgi:hypothetical protein
MFYASANKALRNFLRQLSQLADATLSNAEPLIRFLDLMRLTGQKNVEIDESFNRLSPSPKSVPEIEKAWNILQKIVTKHFDVKPFLLGFIKAIINLKN